MQSRTCTHTKRRHTAGSAHTAGHSSGAHRQMHRHTRENPTSPAWRRLCMWGISLGQWERDESGAIAHTHTPSLEVSGKDESWETELKHEGERRRKNNSPPPSITQLVLTFSLHQLLHNILLALVKRELAWEVEAFFALYFDWLLVDVWVRIEGGGREGGNERVKTKTEWVSMRVLNTHAKKKPNKWNVNKQKTTNYEN